ncbi:MAG: RHS repeat-associated core domain-containing protein [Bacteroidota bacterium]
MHSSDGGSTFLQNTKYAYNERGWLKNSSSGQFNLKLGYDTLASPQYNGNISAQLWGASYGNKFNYQYDKLNRLTNGTSTGVAMSEILSYDAMGNIATLNRDAGGTATYSYSGNRLSGISGGGLTTGAYAYDANGNATTDGRNGVSLTYNFLNLPVTATKSGLSVAYSYDASGKKLSKTSNGVVTNYADGIQYTGTVIDFIQTEEGRASNTTGTYTYEYNLMDHLGNVRYSFDKNAGLLRQLQADDYYGFGLRKVAVTGTNKYLYNSKELQTELGQYDYGARFYDPVIGRWNVIDPLAELGRRWSPYAYAFNNPIYFVDPDGMWGDYFGENGKKIGRDGINDGKKYLVTDNNEARAIAKTNKAGGTTQVGDVKSARALPSDAALNTSLNVLDRTVANGGLKEESALVMKDGTTINGPQGGLPTIENGVQTATTSLPALPTGKTASDVEASIHSHPTKVQVQGDAVFPQSANLPSGQDKTTFSQFGTNIIVGPLGTVGQVTKNADGTFNIPNRANGAVIYNTGQAPIELKRGVIRKIVGQ